MNRFTLCSYIIFFSLFIFKKSEQKSMSRGVASIETSCEELVRPFLDKDKVTKDFMEVFEKGYLTKAEVSVFKDSESAVKAVELYTKDFEEQNYAFATMALIKKRFHYLDVESTVTHYKSVFKKCPN